MNFFEKFETTPVFVGAEVALSDVRILGDRGVVEAVTNLYDHYAHVGFADKAVADDVRIEKELVAELQRALLTHKVSLDEYEVQKFVTGFIEHHQK